MHPILFILALVTGICFLWLAFCFAWYGDTISESAMLWIPLAIIGVTVLTAAGLGMGGVLA